MALKGWTVEERPKKTTSTLSQQEAIFEGRSNLDAFKNALRKVIKGNQ